MEARQGRIQTCVARLTFPEDLMPKCLPKLLPTLAPRSFCQVAESQPASQARGKEVFYKPLRPQLAQMCFCPYLSLLSSYLHQQTFSGIFHGCGSSKGDLLDYHSTSPIAGRGVVSDSPQARSLSIADSLLTSLKVHQGFHDKLSGPCLPSRLPSSCHEPASNLAH